MIRTGLFVLLCLTLAPPAYASMAPRHQPPQYGSQTHLLLPRFVSLSAPEANLRRGPGLQYPIKWVYHRQNLPVLVLREFNNWRLLQFPSGTRGWMDRILLSRHRTFVVTAAHATLRRAPRAQGRPVANLRRGVIGRLHRCKRRVPWCRVSTHGFVGFVRRNQIWGTDYDARRVRLP